jgi:hypothetical protein
MTFEQHNTSTMEGKADQLMEEMYSAKRFNHELVQSFTIVRMNRKATPKKETATASIQSIAWGSKDVAVMTRMLVLGLTAAIHDVDYLVQMGVDFVR